MKKSPVKKTIINSKRFVRKTPVKVVANTQQVIAAKLFPVIIVTNKNFTIKNWSTGAQSLFGWISKETIGKHPDKLLKSAYSSYTAAAIFKKIKQTGTFSGTAVLKNKNKQSIKVQLTITALYDKGGKLTGAVYLINQKAAKEKVKKQATGINNETNTPALSNVFDRVTDAFVAFDNDWRYTFVNKKAIELLGKSKKQLIGKYVWDVFPDDIDQPFYKALHKAKKSQKPSHLELYYAPYDRWYEDHIYPSPTGLSVYFRDITESKKAILSLKESEEKYKSLIEQVSDAAIIYSLDGTIYDFNKTAYEQTGYTKKEFQKLRIPDLLNDEEIVLNPAIAESFKTGKTVLFERKLKLKNGTLADVELNVRMLPDGKLLGFARNITEQKKSLTDLKESEIRFRSLFEHASDGIYIADPEGKYVEVNDSASKLVGYTKEELSKLYLFDLVVKEENAIPLRIDEIKAGKHVIQQRQLRRKDGSVVLVEISSKLLPDGRMLGMVRDLTERIETKNKLQKEKELSEKIINSLPGIFYMYDETGKLMNWNKNFEQVSGYKKEEISNMHPIDFYDLDQKENIKNRIKSVFKNKKVASIEVELLTKKKQKIPFFINSMIIDYEGKPCLIGLGLDLTESKKAAEEVKKSYERFALIGQATHDGLWDWNLESNQVWGNEMHQHLYGLTLADAVPNFEEWKKRIHPDEREKTIKAFDEALSSKRNSYTSEYRFNTENKGWINIYGRTLIERNKEGKPVRLIGSMIDITDSKKAEEALTASENRLRAIYETEPECIKMLNKKGALMEMNPAGLSMIEADSLEMVKGKQVHGIVDKEYKKAFIKLTENVFKNIPGKLEFRITGFKGGKRWLETNAVPFKDKNGKVISLLGITRDITERKKAEEDIKQMIERFQLIAKATNDAVWDWDLENNKIWWSDIFYEKFGFDQKQTPSNVLFKKSIFIDDREKTEHSFNAALEEKVSSWSAEFRFLTKEGKLLTIVDKAFFLKNKEGKIYRIIGAMQDITGQKEEEKRISKATLDAQENERTQIGLELHDNINQILVGALLNLAMTSKVSADKKQDIIEKVKSYIQSSISEIRKVSHRLAPVSFEDGTLKEAFETLLEDVNIENKFNIQLHVDEFDRNKVSGDIQKNLYRILQEQLNNILKYSKANFIEIEITNRSDKIKMQIYDNGVGFNPKEIKRGIGLNNIKKRAEAFSGNFNLVTSPGNGCKLIIEIPLKKKP